MSFMAQRGWNLSLTPLGGGRAVNLAHAGSQQDALPSSYTLMHLPFYWRGGGGVYFSLPRAPTYMFQVQLQPFDLTPHERANPAIHSHEWGNATQQCSIILPLWGKRGQAICALKSLNTR